MVFNPAQTPTELLPSFLGFTSGVFLFALCLLSPCFYIDCCGFVFLFLFCCLFPRFLLIFVVSSSFSFQIQTVGLVVFVVVWSSVDCRLAARVGPAFCVPFLSSFGSRCSCVVIHSVAIL